MNPAVFAVVFASVSLSALAQTAFKIGVSRVEIASSASLLGKAIAFVFSPYVLLGLSLYAVGTVLWLFALRQLDLSLAYPFVAMSFVMVTASGVFFLGETVSMTRLVGLCFVIVGLIVMARTG
jgi:multidrug transporter EmrE-like cation transporter